MALDLIATAAAVLGAPTPVWIGVGLIGIGLLIYSLVGTSEPAEATGQAQSIRESPAGRDLVQAGRDVNIHHGAKAEPKRLPPHPFAQARQLESGWAVTQQRRAMRCIAEDELENLVKPRLEALRKGRTTSMQLATAQWTTHQETVRDMSDQRPYRAGARAYRLVVDLHENLELDARTKKLTKAELVDVLEAFAAVDDAIAVFREYQPCCRD